MIIEVFKYVLILIPFPLAITPHGIVAVKRVVQPVELVLVAVVIVL